jgi:peroxiredoxin
MTKLITPGELAPDFELKDIDGKAIRLSAFRGRVVVLSFLRGFM